RAGVEVEPRRALEQGLARGALRIGARDVIERIVDADEAVIVHHARRRLAILLGPERRALRHARRAGDDGHGAAAAARPASLRGILRVLFGGRLQHEIDALVDPAIAVRVVLDAVAVGAEPAVALDDGRGPAAMEGVAHGIVDRAEVRRSRAQSLL